eukprot:gene24749-45611_t
MRSDFWPFTDQGDIRIQDSPATRRNQVNRVGEEPVRRGALPPRVGWREMQADVALGDGAQH